MGRYYSIYLHRNSDGTHEAETDGPFDEETRNRRAATWTAKEKGPKDFCLKARVADDGCLTVDAFDKQDFAFEDIAVEAKDGVFAPFWTKDGQRIDKVVELADLQNYLDHPAQARTKAAGWQAMMIGDRPVLVASVQRLDLNRLRVGSTEYTYTVEPATRDTTVLTESDLFKDLNRRLVMREQDPVGSSAYLGDCLKATFFLLHEAEITNRRKQPVPA